jgi:hypothetical protein
MDIKKIKDKFKQLKYQHLKKIYAKNLSRFPENCKYNKEVRLPNRSTINLCGFNFEDSCEVDLCYKQEHAKDCNAFCSRKSKEELYIDFVDELKDDSLRATKYKDINTLYWMYPELKFEDYPDKKKWFHSLYYFFKNLF